MTTISKKIICAEEICKSYKYQGEYILVLDDVSLCVEYGESIAIVGSSGSGKSTLLHILGTLDKPDSGKLLFNGEEVLKFKDVRLAHFRNKTVGFVFQFHHLLSSFSALENTMMPALIGGVPKKIAQNQAERLLFRVGMKQRINYKPNQLSGGECQRVAIARALIQNPLVLLADEPTGNLDRKNRMAIQELLLQLNDEIGMTLILVTHSKTLASCMSREISISGGKLFCSAD